MKIIFLDIDGVLNCEQGYEDGFCVYTQIDNYFDSNSAEEILEITIEKYKFEEII